MLTRVVVFLNYFYAVTEWPVPSTKKHLQHFLSFANFYKQFIRNYSKVTAPLAQLTSTKTIHWNGGCTLSVPKTTRFTSAPSSGSGFLLLRKKKYDVGNQKLLTIVLALEEKRHWLLILS